MIVLGAFVLLTGTAFVLQGAAELRSGGSSGTGVRPVLVQQGRPGTAYRYGPASIYNACALLTLDDLRERGLTPAPDQYLDEYYPVADQPALAPELTSPETAPINLTGPSSCGVFLQRGGHIGGGGPASALLQRPGVPRERPPEDGARWHHLPAGWSEGGGATTRRADP